MAGELGGLLAKPQGLNAPEVAICLREEGWMLGAVVTSNFDDTVNG